MTLRQKAVTRKVLIYLILIMMVVASLFPILFCLSASLRTQEDLFQNMFPFSLKSLIPTAATLENYVTIFTQYEFWRPIMNTLIVTIFTIIFGCILNSMAAFAFTCFEFKGKKILFPLVLISFFRGDCHPLIRRGKRSPHGGYLCRNDYTRHRRRTGYLPFHPVLQGYSAKPGGSGKGRRSQMAYDLYKDYHADLCTCVRNRRSYDLHEPMERLYVAFACRTFKRNPHNPDCNQPVQRRTFYPVDLHLCKFHGICNHPNLPVPSVPEVFRRRYYGRQCERIVEYEENISNRKLKS